MGTGRRRDKEDGRGDEGIRGEERSERALQKGGERLPWYPSPWFPLPGLRHIRLTGHSALRFPW